MSDTPIPQAGWYRDPENPAGERWWNGSGWSDHRRDSTTAPPTPPAPPVAAPAFAAPAAVPPVPVAPADSSGFTFGTAASPDSSPRVDPYAPSVYPGYAPAGYGTSPYVGAPYGTPGTGQGTNGLALAGLLVSSVGWIFASILAPIAGIVLSALGLQAANRRAAAGNPNTGRGMAIGGIVVGIAVIVISVLFFALLITVGAES